VNKSDVSFLLVAAAVLLAWWALHRAARKRPNAPQARPEPTSDSIPPAPPAGEIVVPTASRALTARERRHEEIRVLAQGDRCIYCSAEAERPYPYARFQRPSFDLWAVLTGDLPRHWGVRSPSPEDLAPVLCVAHFAIARSAVELRIARAHAEYVAFMGGQKEELFEFTAHGLDETMRAEAERVRKGSTRGGST